MINEKIITQAIIESYTNKLLSSLELDVAVCGAGPSGLVAAYYLAKKGCKVAVFERKLSIGGGMWGGGMMFNEIVVQEEGKGILDEFGITAKPYSEGYYVADAIESVSGLCYNAVKAGAKIFNLISVEDLVVGEDKVAGIVINWTAVEMAGLHVDPLTIFTKAVVDSTGHPVEVVKVLEMKSGIRLRTKTGRMLGEGSMWAQKGEETIVAHSKEICPGLYACGMCANAVFGGPRMGPIFGGMLLAGKKVAADMLKRL